MAFPPLVLLWLHFLRTPMHQPLLRHRLSRYIINGGCTSAPPLCDPLPVRAPETKRPANTERSLCKWALYRSTRWTRTAAIEQSHLQPISPGTDPLHEITGHWFSRGERATELCRQWPRVVSAGEGATSVSRLLKCQLAPVAARVELSFQSNLRPPIEGSARGIRCTGSGGRCSYVVH